MWISFLAIGYLGIAKYVGARGIQATNLDILYRTIQLVAMDSLDFESPLPAEVEIARFVLPTLAALTAVSAIAVLFLERMQSLRLMSIRNHVVICGLGHKGSLLAKAFSDRGFQVVLVDVDADNPRMAELRGRGAITLIGSASQPETLLASGINRATSLIAVCGDDRLNAEIAFVARKVAKPRRWRPLHCLIHSVDPQLYEFLMRVQLSSQIRSSVRLEPFNVYDRGAKLLLQEYPPLPRQGERCAPSLLIVGLGDFGQSILVQAAREWHMQNPATSLKLRIVAVDRDADRICEILTIRYPQLTACCELVPFAIEFEEPAFHRAEYFPRDDGDQPFDTIYVCLEDDSVGLRVVQSLMRHPRTRDITIIIRTKSATSLAGFISDASTRSTPYRNIHAFSLLDQTLTPDLLVNGTNEMLARSLHGQYVRHLKEAGVPPIDAAQSWSSLSEGLRESNRKQVDRIAANLDAVGCLVVPVLDWDVPHFSFSPEEIEMISQLEHSGWCHDLRKDGWRYAPGPKDQGRKTHPFLVDWADLPESEREKNRSSTRELPGILARSSLRIERVIDRSEGNGSRREKV